MRTFFSCLTLMLASNLMSAQCLEANYSFTGNAADSSGNERHAVVNGASLTTDRFGNPNSAYEFNGINNFIDTETTFDYQNRTISAWFMTYDTTKFGVVLDQDDIELNYGTIGLAIYNGDLVGNSGGHGFVVLETAPILNQWYHVVLVRNETDSKIYLDGKLVYTGTPTEHGSSANPNPEMVVGVGRTENNRFFNGKIDDVKVYSCELDSLEIDKLYNSIEEHAEINVSISPNPMSYFTVLKFDNSKQKSYSLTLTDQQGKFIRTIENITGNEVRIDRNNLSSGIYFFQLQTANQVSATGKIILE